MIAEQDHMTGHFAWYYFVIIANLISLLIHYLFIFTIWKKLSTRGQFHQRFTSSFFARRSRKSKKIQLRHLYFFTISGSASLKAACKRWWNWHLFEAVQIIRDILGGRRSITWTFFCFFKLWFYVMHLEVKKSCQWARYNFKISHFNI